MPAQLTWWGHATATLTDGDVRVLTDPVLTDRLAHLVRRGGGPLPRAARDADVVLVSHAHADHLHLPSLRQLPKHVRVLVPPGLGGFVRRATGHDAVELPVGQAFHVGHVTIEAVPAEHSGARSPWSSPGGPAMGFVVTGERRTYVAGDTDIFDGMADIGAGDRGLDLAVLPVGGWGPTLGQGHLDPERAALALRLLRPRVAVPYHWGTLWPRGLRGFRDHLFALPGAQFERAAARVAPEVDVRLLHPLGSVDLG